jgi:hypothetical protein
MNRWILILSAALFTVGAASAQNSEPGEPAKTQIHVQGFSTTEPGMLWLQEGVGARIPEGDVAFLSLHLAGDQEIVRNAPYSATIVNESTQTLADGNRIVQKSSASVARDSQGRTRREETIHRMGPLQVDAPKMVTIIDPVTHSNFIVMPDLQTAKVLKNEHVSIEGPVNAKTRVRELRSQKTSLPRRETGIEVKHEDLGTQEIEGLACQGKRETVTIPAGRIGNEQPIVATNEVWIAQDLHVVVLEKHSDPRSGESVYRLTSISRNEPDASLFQVPAGYKTISPSEGVSTRE